MNIEIIHLKGRTSLKEYESDLIPNIGDWFAGINFDDHQHRTVINRLIFPNAPNFVAIYVDYTSPELNNIE